MRVLSLFSGIGGLDLGLYWAGFETVGWVEREPFCRRVMEHHWPGLWNHDDITTLDPEDAVRGCGGIDLICGGFPCQPVSTAGKRRGAADARWLWPDMARVIRGIRPAWVLAENVPGLRSLGADDVLGDLEAAGYACWPLVVGAHHVGAPHKRQRVFIVAHRHGERLEVDSGQRTHASTELAAAIGSGREVQTREQLADGGNPPMADAGSVEGAQRHDAAMLGRWQEETEQAGLGGHVEHAQGLQRRQGRQSARERSGRLGRPGAFRWPMPPGPVQWYWEPYRLIEFPAVRRVRDAAGVEVLALGQSREDGAAGQPQLELGDPLDGLSRRLAERNRGLARRLVRRAKFRNKQRLRALGNAVVPQVAYVLGLAIRDLMSLESSR